MTDSMTAEYPETADIETSTDDYAKRFQGPAGEWMIKKQESIAMSFAGDFPGATVLDIGGGHGQIAIPMCQSGYKVTVLSSSESCRHRIKSIVESGSCQFKVGNVIQLPFPDKSFDIVVSFRLLTHCTQWPTLVREMCRTARKAVIIDYPTSQSINAVAPMLFSAKKKIEADTRHWTLFRHGEVLNEFVKNGWDRDRIKGQFFFPMVLHRSLKLRTLSAFLEGAARITGLTALAGSPVIVRMRPR